MSEFAESQGRIVPGTVCVAGRRFRYLEFSSSSETLSDLFGCLGRSLEKDYRGNLGDGGIITENVIITLPSGQRFGGISFKADDLDAWESAVVQFALGTQRRIGWIDNERFRQGNGEVVALAECQVDFVQHVRPKNARRKK